MVKISVIMPVYNSSDFLSMSLDSVLNQTIDDIEIICVNDGSTDNSANILKKYSEFDFIKIINQENLGSGEARNKGMSFATGEYIAFLDSDDVFLDVNALSQMYGLAIKTNADMVAANLKRIKKNGTIEENYDYENTLFTYFYEKSLISPQEYGIPWAFYKNIYKRSFLNENDIKFPNLSRGQDPIFLAKVLTKIKRIHALPIDLYGYNHSASGGVNVKVNNYEKKFDYLKHFVDTFEILQNKGFNESLSLYKKEFIDYLNFRGNIFDEDIKKIISELTQLDEFFKKEDYGYFIIDLIKNPSNEENEEYDLIKECLFEESMLEDTFIDVYRLKNFAEISKNSIQQENMLKSSFKQLKDIEQYTFDKKRELSGKIDRFKNEITHYIHLNNEILTSNSWKVTSYLRTLKHKL